MSSSTSRYNNPPLLIFLDDKLKKEEKEIARSVLENIFRRLEGLGGIKILKCYSNEPCEYFPNHTDVPKIYIP